MGGTHAAESTPGPAATTPPRRSLVALSLEESLGLLAGAQLGRIVSHHRAMPMVRPVNHILDGEHLYIRTHDGSAIAAVAALADGRGAVVAYEVDEIDPDTRLGWSVLVVGRARLVRDPGEVLRVGEHLVPWVDGDMDQLVRVEPEDVTGFRLV